MSNFPLYISLKDNLPNKDLSLIQKKELVNNINSLDSDTQEIIYALIKSFYIDNNKGYPLTIPYNAIISSDKIDFDLTNFPEKLRQLLYKFIFIHSKKIDEDKKLGK